MSHDHSHNHGHNHHHPQVTDRLNKAFKLGILLNLAYVVIEMGAGFWFNSLALISDAGHNFTDVISLVLAALAYKLAARPSTNQFTYGYRKSTILVSLINSVILFIAIGAILWETIERINHPVELNGSWIAITAGVGILINGFTAYLFFKDQSKDLNVRGAYLHMVADTAVSIGVVVSGLFIMWFGIYWIDTLTSLVVVGVILYSTWHLFRDSLHLALDGVPSDIDIDKVTAAIEGVDGVEGSHHLHVWAISTTQNAMTAHIVVSANNNMEQLSEIRQHIKNKVLEQNIHHATLEFETPEDKCLDTNTQHG